MLIANKDQFQQPFENKLFKTKSSNRQINCSKSHQISKLLLKPGMWKQKRLNFYGSRSTLKKETGSGSKLGSIWLFEELEAFFIKHGAGMWKQLNFCESGSTLKKKIEAEANSEATSFIQSWKQKQRIFYSFHIPGWYWLLLAFSVAFNTVTSCIFKLKWVFLENDKTDLGKFFSGFRRKLLFITTSIEKHCT